MRFATCVISETSAILELGELTINSLGTRLISIQTEALDSTSALGHILERSFVKRAKIALDETG